MLIEYLESSTRCLRAAIALSRRGLRHHTGSEREDRRGEIFGAAAEQAGAPELAPVEMAAARDKLARAEKAAADRDAQPATELAEQANADAQLAEATAQEKRSHKAALELDASLQALRQESLRNTQSNQ